MLYRQSPFCSLLSLLSLMTVFTILNGCARPRPPMMEAYQPIDEVEICAEGVCGKAGGKFALKDIAKATAELMKLNASGEIDICEADPITRRCLNDGIAYTLHGIISVAGLISKADLRSGVRYNNEREVYSNMNIPTLIMGEYSVCQDARTVFSVKAPQMITWNSNTYNCGWGGGPQDAVGKGRMNIQFIDFDQGVWAGEFAIRVTGGVTGWKDGYVVARFNHGMHAVNQKWIQPRTLMPKSARIQLPLPEPIQQLYSNPAEQAIDMIPVDKIDQVLVNPATIGNYYALVIGNDKYQHILPLESAVKDARSIAELLQNQYGFTVYLLENATRASILTSLENLRKSLIKTDNLLIYYAGHGWLDRESDEGFWLPVDAEANSQLQWIPNTAITRALRAIQAKHVMVVADSCYSGKLSRGLHINPQTPDFFLRIANKRTRVVMSSGGLEPVLDAGGEGGHSVFTGAFIRALENNRSIIEGTRLFSEIRRKVMLDADQTPEYADIRKAGHEGGDFLFLRR